MAAKRHRLFRALTLSLCIWAGGSGVSTGLSASAASHAGSRITETHRVPLNHTELDPTRVLDYRRPTETLTFEMPGNDWTESLEVLISARAQGPVDAATPLLIQFNDDEPLRIYAQGDDFDARIRPDRSHVKAKTNILTVTYPAPRGEACLSEQHGAWVIDADRSAVIVTARAKRGIPTLADMKTRLRAPSTAPQTVNIKAVGTDKTALRALAAQGVALNLNQVPDFRLDASSADLHITTATRQALRKIMPASVIPTGTGPVIAMRMGKKPHIIITADTQAELLAATRAFAATPLPALHTSTASPQDYAQNTGKTERPVLAAGSTALSGLTSYTPRRDWAARPLTARFDVRDPAAATGTLSLQVKGGKNLSETSSLTARLNGHVIGNVTPKRGTRTVNMDIPRGLLKGRDNRLTVTPTLVPARALEACAAPQNDPGFELGAQSLITLHYDAPSAPTDLSRFAAPSSLFSGADTAVYLNADARSDMVAGLKFLAALAQGNGSSLQNATYFGTDAALPQQGNVLVLGPVFGSTDPIFNASPKTLTQALFGPGAKASIITQQATLQRPNAVRLLSTQERIDGGTAALWQDGERLIGLIAATRGHAFSEAVNTILPTDQWNALEGSTARWNSETVLMTRTAVPLNGPAANTRMATLHKVREIIAPTDFTWDSVKLPKLPGSDLSLPRVSVPKLSLPSFKKSDKTAEPDMITATPLTEPVTDVAVTETNVTKTPVVMETAPAATPKKRVITTSALTPPPPLLRGLADGPVGDYAGKAHTVASYGLDAALERVTTVPELTNPVTGEPVKARLSVFAVLMMIFLMMWTLIRPIETTDRPS